MHNFYIDASVALFFLLAVMCFSSVIDADEKVVRVAFAIPGAIFTAMAWWGMSQPGF